MSAIKHRQYDERPYRDLVLDYRNKQGELLPTEQWPALLPTDKVTMLVKRGATSTPVTLHVVSLAARRVQWRPGGDPLRTTAGSGTYVVRVTDTVSGESYTHPESGSFPFEIEAANITPDPADPE